jgi:hypothetical protein
MSKPQRGGEPLELSGGALGTLAFQWSGDRYEHQWHFPDQLESVALRSIESGGDLAWPVSPPLQQIHHQKFVDGRQVVFGVGMAGRGHWSASFTLVPELSCWIVELACRASVAPEILMSSYRLSGCWTPAGDSGFRCDRGSPSLSLEPIQPSSSAELNNDILRITPQIAVQSAATHQWAFRLRIAK